MVEQIRQRQCGKENGMETREKLETIAKDIRSDILLMGLHSGTKGAHIGGGMSCVEILATLYGSIMQYDCKNPKWENRDRFIMSKAHSAIALYAALKYAGYLSQEDIEGALQGRSWLYKHPKYDVQHGFEFSGGSLGQGLALAVGSAIALRRKGNEQSKFYVLIGDGECDEGSVWEAASSVCHFGLKNVIPIIDLNGLQNDGTTQRVMNLGSMAERFKSIGFDVVEVNGHDVMDLQNGFLKEAEQPKVIIAHTVKGKGVSFAENNVDWHISYLTNELYEQVIGEWEHAGD